MKLTSILCCGAKADTTEPAVPAIVLHSADQRKKTRAANPARSTAGSSKTDPSPTRAASPMLRTTTKSSTLTAGSSVGRGSRRPSNSQSFDAGSELSKYDDGLDLMRTQSAAPARSTLETLAPLKKSRTTLSKAATQHAKQAKSLPPTKSFGPSFESIRGHKAHVEHLKGLPSVGFAEATGRRLDMQDAACARNITRGALIALFDGHGASGVIAKKAVEVVPQHIDEALAALSEDQRKDPDIVRRVIKRAFATEESKFDYDLHEGGIQGALEKIGERQKSGSTGLVVILLDDDLYIANLGDSRALLVEEGGVCPLSFDHKPKDEIDRLARRGSKVVDNRIEDDLGVAGGMGANRKLGTRRRPQVVHIKVPKGPAQIVLGCDGIFDVLTNEKVASMTRHAIRGSGWDAMEAGKEVVSVSYGAKSTDNMSVVVWNLPRGH